MRHSTKEALGALCLAISIIAFMVSLFSFLNRKALEKDAREYNNGVCPTCGYELRLYTVTTNQKCYICDNCEYIAWISY